MNAIAAVLLACLLPQSDVKEIKGCVVDGEGKPVAGVPVAAFWTIVDGAWTPGGPLLATSDDQGAFAKKILVPLLFSLMARPARTFVGQVQMTGEKQLLRLPPGDYAVRTFARDAVTFDASFTVPAETAKMNVGPGAGAGQEA